MKIGKYIILCLVAFLAISSCKEEKNPYQLISLKERNQLDSEAIIKYLKTNGFNQAGKAMPLSVLPEGTQALYDLAKKDESGYWYVVNPKVQANGSSITSNAKDSILIQYNLFSFVPTKITDEKSDKGYDLKVVPNMVESTINTTGLPMWDPSFYYIKPSKNRNPELYEIPALINGLKHFKATNRSIDAKPAVQFQGLIIVPSKLAFARKPNQLLQGFDHSFILNFEIYQVKPRK
ncbi:hypothetical protein EDM00_02315 [Ornithobacterium rhinotracheale]|uniref:hypothetical protein n=1 Tax=Ornithobacterium rhinotracheale TaxID=28251 RepID=UPI00129CD7AD|nr:hypothetical protein [Ornithobacterium rhinotracheale]MRI62837.1 hypothetical protein [Ornithobacterium rhinotracheale]MRJ08255.1 hypothetical protein [Ornithobacterium rhinotracheale]MRJ09895.1 hypothetical protein [Ornithobacterium rhinotracheale]UOH77451.1 hypothetical protein MT996_09550 [Ornithobacterium rhinotracheale]